MKSPQFTISLASALEYAHIPVTYEVLSFKGEKMGMFPVLGEGDGSTPNVFEHFPIFDEEYRPILVGKILDKYWNFEIGAESTDMFWSNVRRWLNMNMPYYNEFYRKISFEDALKTVNIKNTASSKSDNTVDSKTEGSTDTNSENSGIAWDDQMPITGMAENESYVTSASKNSGKSETKGTVKDEGNTNSHTEDTSESSTVGYQGNLNALQADYRDNIVNTDAMVVTGMRPLFSLVWRNSETATTTEYLRGLL